MINQSHKGPLGKGLIPLLIAVLIAAFTFVAPAAPATAAGTFTVNMIYDIKDFNPGDGQCDTVPDASLPGDQCTLRAAIMEANADGTPDIIILPAGTYKLTLGGTYEDSALTGDLDIRYGLRIYGSGAASTIVDGNGVDRVFDVYGPGTDVQINAITIQGGETNANGGGIRHMAAKLALHNTRIIGNTSGIGGGIFSMSGTLTLDDSRVTDNTAVSGGAMHILTDGSATIKQTTIAGNQAAERGGAITNQGSLTLTHSTISDNRAQNGAGGGIFNAGTLAIVNTTLSNNRSTTIGGGMYEGSSANAVLNGVTLVNNRAPIAGEALYQEVGTGVLIVKSSLLAEAPVDAITECQGLIVSGGYNLLQSSAGCIIAGDLAGNQLDVNPRLGPLQDNGGATFTHAPLWNSPVIDASKPNLPGQPMLCASSDQRGYGRYVDGNLDGTIACDIGAVEYSGPAITSFAPQPVANGQPFTLYVYGKRLDASSVVRWGTTDLPTTYVSNDLLLAAVPAELLTNGGQVNVRVATPVAGIGRGISRPVALVVNNPVPVLAGLSPASKPAGSAIFTLAVTGANFTPASVVRWKGAGLPTTFINSTTLKVSIPAAKLATAGIANVRVFTPTPGGGTSDKLAFTITP